jgi:hypothetical protein
VKSFEDIEESTNSLMIALMLGCAVVCQAQLRIAPNDPSIYYSPYAWAVSSLNASTINSGSYFRVLFTGTTATLTFDVSQMVTPASQLYWSTRVCMRDPYVCVILTCVCARSLPTGELTTLV